MKLFTQNFPPCTTLPNGTPAGAFAAWLGIQPRKMLYSNFCSALRRAVCGTRSNKYRLPYSKWDAVLEVVGTVFAFILIAALVIISCAL